MISRMTKKWILIICAFLLGIGGILLFAQTDAQTNTKTNTQMGTKTYQNESAVPPTKKSGDVSGPFLGTNPSDMDQINKALIKNANEPSQTMPQKNTNPKSAPPPQTTTPVVKPALEPSGQPENQPAQSQPNSESPTSGTPTPSTPPGKQSQEFLRGY